MNESIGSGFGEKPQTSAEDATGKLIHMIIEHLNDLICKMPFLIDGEETRDTYQQEYQKIVGMFKGVEAKYQELSGVIEICFDSEDVYGLMQDVFYREYDLSIGRFVSSLNGIFPSNLAEVNIPKYCHNNDYNIPDIKRWQHSKKLRPETADKEYMDFTKQAKDGVIDDLRTQERPTFPADFAIDYPERFADDNDRRILATLLVKFVECQEEDGGTLDHKRDLKNANEILKFINRMKIPNKEQLTRKYIEVTVEANYPRARSLAESAAEKKMSEVLGNRLTILAEKLNGYEVAPGVATKALGRVKKKKEKKNEKGRRYNSEGDSGNTQTLEVKLKVGEYIKLDHETFPWLDKDMVEVLCIERGGNGATVVVDARTEATKDIEYNMTGYEAEKSQSILSIFREKLNFAAKLISTSDSSLRDRWRSLKCRDKTQYPFNILAWKPKESDARRLYVSDVIVDMLPDGPTKSALVEAGMSHLLMLLGICDKNNQPKLLSVFTGRPSYTEARNGAGK